MRARRIRSLQSDDFPELMRLEEEVFGASGESVLGPTTSGSAASSSPTPASSPSERGRAVGYVLTFVRGREAYCTTLAVAADATALPRAIQLLRALVGAIAGRVDACWFTVKEDNLAARALHAALGARERRDPRRLLRARRRRIVSRIERRASSGSAGACAPRSRGRRRRSAGREAGARGRR